MNYLERAKAATEKARAVPGFRGATLGHGNSTGDIAMSVESFEVLVGAAIDANVRLDFSLMPVTEVSKIVDRMRAGALAERQERTGATEEPVDRSTDAEGFNMHDEWPQYKHDCTSCVFLGSFDGNDMWFHPGDNPSVIARYGADGPDYRSGLRFIYDEPTLALAYARAHQRGLV